MSQMKAGRKSEAMSMLRQKGISPTHQRLEVLKYLQDYPGHPSAEEVFAALQGVEPPLSKASVYNILRLFEEKGIVSSLSIDARSLRYDLIIQHHGHFQCQGCGQIVNFTAPLDEHSFQGLEGFEIRQKDIYFRGICPNCQQGAQSPISIQEETT